MNDVNEIEYNLLGYLISLFEADGWEKERREYEGVGHD